MTRLRAFATHIALSGLVLLLFITIVMTLWYPSPYFGIDGGWTILQVLIGVDLVLGPLLTLIVFKPAKPSLKFDMSCIALLQVGALLYGGWTIYQGRPVFVVFSVDRFVTVAPAEYEAEKLRYPELRKEPLSGPRLVLAKSPQDSKEREALLFGAAGGGRDLEQSAQYYHPYEPDPDLLGNRSIDMDQIMALSAAAKTEVEQFLRSSQQSLDAFFYFPLVGKNKDVVMVLNRSDASPVGIIDIDPWASSYRRQAATAAVGKDSPLPEQNL